MTTTQAGSQVAPLVTQTMTDEEMAEAGLPVEDVPLVAIGGGLGTFALVDRLRVGGVSTTDITVISPHLRPDHNFAAACRASGLAGDGKLHSDSSARIDNLWGFPGYAVEEAWRRKSPAPLARVVLEPVFCEFYTPTVELMREGLAREAERIGWPEMVAQGVAERVVKRAGGGYFVVRRGRGDRRTVYRCDSVHLSLGAAGLQVTAAAREFREHGQHGDRVVHVYEPHEHVYQALAAKGGSVLVRGSGIAAATVLERLIQVREASSHKIHIWQLSRNYQEGVTGTRRARRDGGFTYQAFSFPKAAFAGQLRETTARLLEEDRLDLIRELGATSTPYWKAWARELRRGGEEGWYDAVVGEVSRFGFGKGKVRTGIRLENGENFNLAVKFVIDATGLDTAMQHHPLVAELVATGGAGVNALGGLRVDGGFSVVGCESGNGRVFATGMTARGAPLGPVDSFEGLQSAALAVADQLAEEGLGERLTPARSVAAWWKWMGGRSL